MQRVWLHVEVQNAADAWLPAPASTSPSVHATLRCGNEYMLIQGPGAASPMIRTLETGVQRSRRPTKSMTMILV